MTEPASIRYKNPGAMWGSALAKKWGATNTVKLNDGLGQGNNIAVFPTYVQGICAQLDLWRTSPNYKNKPFAKAIAVWAGGNSVESYIAFVLKRVPGMTRDTVMNDEFWRGPMCIPFLKAQAWHEAGKKYPAPDADWIEAKRRVLGNDSVLVPFPPPPDVPKPDHPKMPKVEAPKPIEPPSKPLVKSKTFWSSIAAALSTVGGFLTDWRVVAMIIVLAALAYIVWERNGKPDIRGWFK